MGPVGGELGSDVQGRVHEPATQGGTGVGRRIVHGVFHVVSCQQLTHLVAGYERTVQATVGDVVVVELKLFHLGEGDVRATAFERVEQTLLGGPVHAVGERIVCTTLQRVQNAAPLPIIVSIVVAGSELASASPWVSMKALTAA